VRPLAYSLQFRGTATGVAARVLETRALAPCALLGSPEDEEAVLESRLALGPGGSFDATGAVIFAPRDVIRFRTVGVGHLAPSPDPHLEHGTVMLEITGGEGRFEGAQGRITSNFFISDTGELTDNQFALLFVPCASMDESHALSQSPRSAHR
jgi:hypothetical protein